VIAEPTERRSSKRFAVDADRAEVVVEFDGVDHRAVMSDMSASGFGLLLLKGSKIAPGSRLQLTEADADTVFTLEVVHVRPEECFLYVGVRRVSDTTRFSIPLFRWAGRTYELKMPIGAAPLIFVGVIVGFSGTCIGLVELMRGVGNDRGTQSSAHQQFLHDRSTRISPEEKRERLLERSQKQRSRQLLTRPELLESTSLWERLTGPNREQVGRLVGNRNISWSELVSQLELSKEQQSRIQGLLNSNDAQKVQAARSQMLTMLTAEQRSAFNQLLAALPIN
jgi:hypothetical protein